MVDTEVFSRLAAALEQSAERASQAGVSLRELEAAAATLLTPGKTYVLFHARSLRANGRHVWCLDGLGAAYAAQLAIAEHFGDFEEGAGGCLKMVPAMYGKPPELDLEAGDTVYLLDLTYPSPVLETWADSGATVQVIDHHKQAMDDLSTLSDRVLSKFDMSRSGAVMAWQYFYGDEPVPALLEYIQDRDLWTKALPNSDRINLGLRELTKGQTLEGAFHVFDELFWETDEEALERLNKIGKEVEREIDQAKIEALERCTKRLILGHKVVFFVTYTERQMEAYSDLAHTLLNTHPDCEFACVQSGEGWALRSNGSHMDVNGVAKALGGGGHPKASGCGADMPLWVAKFLQALRGVLCDML